MWLHEIVRTSNAKFFAQMSISIILSLLFASPTTMYTSLGYQTSGYISFFRQEVSFHIFNSEMRRCYGLASYQKRAEAELKKNKNGRSWIHVTLR